MRRALSTILLLVFATAGAAAEIGGVHSRARIEQALTGAPATIHAEAVVRHGRERDTRALLATLERIESDAGIDETVRTVLIQDALVAFAATPPTPSARAVLQAHAADPRTLRVWHEDEGHRVAITAYDTGAAARYALREWRRTETRVETLAALAGGRWRADHSSVPAGVADAFAVAPATQLAAARNELVSGLAAGIELERPALTAAQRIGDLALARQVIEHGRAAIVVHELGGVAGAFPDQDAFMLMTHASARADIGAAGVALIGRLSATLPAARGWLFERLGDPRLGAAAAAALSHDAGAIGDLQARLTAADPLTRNRAALALHLNGSGLAHDALARALDDPAVPVELRRNIATWLR